MYALTTFIQDKAYVAAGFGSETYHNATTLYPVGLVILIICCVLLFQLPRSRAILPLLAIQTIVPASQRIVILGLDFSFSRVLILLGIARIILWGEYRWWKPIKLDKWMLAWAVASVVVFTIRRGSGGALVNRLGFCVDTFGLYCITRVWIRSLNDVNAISGTFVWLACIACLCFLYEKTTQSNIYAWVGGANGYTSIRDGAVRCMGSFKHPILAGTFWVGALPWLIARYIGSPRRRMTSALGVVACLITVITTTSSTPYLGVVAVIGGFCFYPLRHHMILILRMAVAATVGLHLVMNKPVWHLVSRVSITSGSTGYHRYRLIDAAITHWRDWILMGTVSTAGWGFYLFDVTNQFVKEAVDGGILGFTAFLGYVATAFSILGYLWRRMSKRRSAVWMIWGLGVAIFSQCVMFIGISINHGAQNLLIWLLPIGVSGGLYQSVRGAHRLRQREQARIAANLGGGQ